MNDELHSNPPEILATARPADVENAKPFPEINARAIAQSLTDLLGQHSERDLLLILIGQVLQTQAEIRILQATVNTLLIELCHRQPDKLSQNLNRMSAQRVQELLTQFRRESNAFGRHNRAETPTA